jgi:hypothetical protein
MAKSADRLTCPHCRKEFDARLLGRGTPRAGYKCPHCRLFIPLERAERPAEHEAA